MRLVMHISHFGKRVYLCEVCANGYVDEITAKECEDYCRTHDRPSQQVSKRAVFKPQQI